MLSLDTDDDGVFIRGDTENGVRFGMNDALDGIGFGISTIKELDRNVNIRST
jgi:hypothetical protein